ncbi:restriction endonuclease subunit S [Acetobacterium wieringae]|uniref:restriction endonuclease subunit S n=1 Tax=Acetobacterium wieringae TaxID=52694 RepID=UPI0026F1A568|nr:restriction endonuclease subunit S [Acetobacterium wieringae]
MSFRETLVGILPADWKVDVIDNLKANKRNAISMGPFGSKIKKECFVVSGIPIIRGTNLKPFYFNEDEFVFVTEEKSLELKSSFVERKDIVITHRGTLGQVGYIPEGSKFQKYIVSQSGMKLTCDENKIISKFLYYYLNSSMGQNFLLMNRSQVGVPAIAQASTALKKIPVPIPSLTEQKAIAHILSTLDEKIEVNNQINKTLEKMAQAIFKQWFVDFEFPNEDGEPYQSSGGEMVESELGLVPKGWEVAELQDVAQITMGQSPKGTSYNETGEGMVFYQGRTDFNKRFPLRRLFTTEPKRIAKKGDILLSVRAPVGDLNIANEDCCIGRGLGALRSKEGFDSYLLCTMFKLKEKFDIFNGEGTVFGSINKNDLCSLKIIKAPDDVISQFEKVVSLIDKQIYTLEMESRKLTRIRDELLPRLMSGEIRVPFLDGFNEL